MASKNKRRRAKKPAGHNETTNMEFMAFLLDLIPRGIRGASFGLFLSLLVIMGNRNNPDYQLPEFLLTLTLGPCIFGAPGVAADFLSEYHCNKGPRNEF